MIRLRRLAVLALLAASNGFAAEFVQAVEFPYYHPPRPLWERELVWLKNIGIRTVAFSGGQNPPRTDPRADLAGFLQILRRLGMRAWIYGVSPELTATLEPQLERHGGPIAFVEGPSKLAAPAPPLPGTRSSGTASDTLFRGRAAFAGGRGSLLWQDVEDTLAPALRRGIVSFSGDERPGATALRRDAALLHYWAAILPTLHTERKLNGKMAAIQLLSTGPRRVSAVALSDQTIAVIKGTVRVLAPC